MTTRYSQTFGRGMLKYMQKHNISYRDLTDRTGIAHSSLSEYANGKHSVPLHYAVVIARAFNMSIEELVELGEEAGSRKSGCW